MRRTHIRGRPASLTLCQKEMGDLGQKWYATRHEEHLIGEPRRLVPFSPTSEQMEARGSLIFISYLVFACCGHVSDSQIESNEFRIPLLC